MTEILEDISVSTEGRKLYSSRAIGLATFIGTPLATGYLIHQNYLTLGQSENANKALAIGIMATIAIFGGIFFLPETLMNKLPNAVIPVIYTGIAYGIIAKTIGPILDEHKKLGHEFFSLWRAAGVGVISAIITVLAIFALSFVLIDDSYTAEYDAGMEQFTANEAEAMAFFEHLETRSNHRLINEIDQIVLPKWKENVELTDRMNQIESMPEELTRQNKILLEYSQLRIKAFTLIRRELDNPDENHSDEINRLHEEIDKKLEEL